MTKAATEEAGGGPVDSVDAPTLSSYSVSVALYGGPLDPNATHDTPNPAGSDSSSSANHVGIAVHAASDATTCYLHHARSPSQVRFIYDPRPAQPFLGVDPALRAACELASLDATGAARANEALAAFGADETHLPWFGAGNCHDWTAAGVRALEDAGIVPQGVGAVWTRLIGAGPVAMANAWAAHGGVVVRNENFGARDGEEADARWAEREELVVRRLDGARMGMAEALLGRVQRKGA